MTAPGVSITPPMLQGPVQGMGRGFGNSAWMPWQGSALGGRSAFQGAAKASSRHSQHILPGRLCHAIARPCSFCRDFLVFKENSLLQAHRAGKPSSFSPQPGASSVAASLAPREPGWCQELHPWSCACSPFPDTLLSPGTAPAVWRADRQPLPRSYCY